MKHRMAFGLATALLGAGIGNAQGFEHHVAVSAVADGVQPYLGWRASHRSGFGFFSELGVMATDAEVSLRASGPAADNPRFQDDLRK
ncbi:hypothetical protein FGL86_11960 [Pistricoccus aurantiacus]|uniref:Uncharacterized protein n=1 Tax=Pistricoccus aurantiacus TaxID=1883414 RepID=A0A5B8SRG9_9GAMM|nr:hypothetical protein [Pistricoccus aurantiacus]QEA39712.1 hypothetical protein FGL86_11960 [Pistricoccus aurantiacus]